MNKAELIDAIAKDAKLSKASAKTPLKLISIQSPIFNGEDRIFEEK